MSCENVQDLISSVLDGSETGAERKSALAHLGACRTCRTQVQRARSLRGVLLDAVPPRMPAELKARLRVLASHEIERRKRSVNFTTWVQHWVSRVRLSIDNMARPFALPVTGGILSAILLLGTWVPTLATKASSDDVPLPSWVYTGPTPLRYSPVGVGEIEVELTIDEQGRVSDYSVTHGEMTPELSSMILLDRFRPAVRFGQPTMGKLVYRASRISVIG